MAIISNAVTIADAGAFSVSLGSMVHIKTLTGGSSTTTISFVHGSSDVVLDSTYPIYKIQFINVHANANTPNMSFNLSTDGGSNYNVTKTSTAFHAWHKEDDSATNLSFTAGNSLAQGTGGQRLTSGGMDVANADGNVSGELTIYNPSSTTFVKHFMARSSLNSYHPYEYDLHIAGYANTTSAINAIQFTIETNNFDNGIFKLYGIKDS
tara:strand:+ start:552 stop:1178 length:627 start_codon:yes stop_codon:yes gene_type:complete